MNTTSLIVEVLVGGFITLLWIFLIIIKVYDVDLQVLQETILKYQDWSGYILFSTMAFSYQLGWLMIHASYIATSKYLVLPIRKNVFEESYSDYRKIKNTVYFRSSDELMAGIEKDRSVIRLSRTGLLNFSVLAIVLLSYQLWWLALSAFIISIVSLLQLRSMYRSLYTKLKNSYAEIIVPD